MGLKRIYLINERSYWGGKLRFATHATILSHNLSEKTCPASPTVASANLHPWS